jgi:hypothetical protein
MHDLILTRYPVKKKGVIFIGLKNPVILFVYLYLVPSTRHLDDWRGTKGQPLEEKQKDNRWKRNVTGRGILNGYQSMGLGSMILLQNP